MIADKLTNDEVRIIIRNGQHIAKRDIKRSPLWYLASCLFGVGSTSGHEICRRAGLNPDDKANRFWEPL